jgi:hypothetical protein
VTALAANTADLARAQFGALDLVDEIVTIIPTG